MLLPLHASREHVYVWGGGGARGWGAACCTHPAADMYCVLIMVALSTGQMGSASRWGTRLHLRVASLTLCGLVLTLCVCVVGVGALEQVPDASTIVYSTNRARSWLKRMGQTLGDKWRLGVSVYLRTADVYTVFITQRVHMSTRMHICERAHTQTTRTGATDPAITEFWTTRQRQD